MIDVGKKKQSENVLFFFPSADYFRSHLLAFSSNLDEHNPDVAEWRLDVSRVIKNALIQVQIPLSLPLSLSLPPPLFSWEPIASLPLMSDRISDGLQVQCDPGGADRQ